MAKEYDVFLSKNTKDLIVAQKILSALRSRGLTVFESSSELRVLGDADFIRKIDEALENSNHLIVLCTDKEHGTGIGNDSKWVYYEWSSFRNEILSGRKSGNIVVVTDGQVDTASLAYGLRKYEVTHMGDVSNDSFLNYFRNTEVAKSEPVLRPMTETSDEDTVMYLKAFDFGHHIAMNNFAYQQNKSPQYDMSEDFENFAKVPAIFLQPTTPDVAFEKISEAYGEKIGKFFSFGQRAGLLSIVSMFAFKGADLTDSQKDVFMEPFISEGRSLNLSEKTLNYVAGLLEGAVSEKQVLKIVQVVRHAILTAVQPIFCPYCGASAAFDASRCPDCDAPLNQK